LKSDGVSDVGDVGNVGKSWCVSNNNYNKLILWNSILPRNITSNICAIMPTYQNKDQYKPVTKSELQMYICQCGEEVNSYYKNFHVCK
jgi:hypothetical protein